MTATIIAHGEDLTTACQLGLNAARQAGAARVRWGAVEFSILPGDSIEAAHRAYFDAARVLREQRERNRIPLREELERVQ